MLIGYQWVGPKLAGWRRVCTMDAGSVADALIPLAGGADSDQGKEALHAIDHQWERVSVAAVLRRVMDSVVKPDEATALPRLLGLVVLAAEREAPRMEVVRNAGQIVLCVASRCEAAPAEKDVAERALEDLGAVLRAYGDVATVVAAVGEALDDDAKRAHGADLIHAGKAVLRGATAAELPTRPAPPSPLRGAAASWLRTLADVSMVRPSVRRELDRLEFSEPLCEAASAPPIWPALETGSWAAVAEAAGRAASRSTRGDDSAGSRLDSKRRAVHELELWAQTATAACSAAIEACGALPGGQLDNEELDGLAALFAAACAMPLLGYAWTRWLVDCRADPEAARRRLQELEGRQAALLQALAAAMHDRHASDAVAALGPLAVSQVLARTEAEFGADGLDPDDEDAAIQSGRCLWTMTSCSYVVSALSLGARQPSTANALVSCLLVLPARPPPPERSLRQGASAAWWPRRVQAPALRPPLRLLRVISRQAQHPHPAVRAPAVLALAHLLHHGSAAAMAPDLPLCVDTLVKALACREAPWLSSAIRALATAARATAAGHSQEAARATQTGVAEAFLRELPYAARRASALEAWTEAGSDLIHALCPSVWWPVAAKALERTLDVAEDACARGEYGNADGNWRTVVGALRLAEALASVSGPRATALAEPAADGVVACIAYAGAHANDEVVASVVVAAGALLRALWNQDEVATMVAFRCAARAALGQAPPAPAAERVAGALRRTWEEAVAEPVRASRADLEQPAARQI